MGVSLEISRGGAVWSHTELRKKRRYGLKKSLEGEDNSKWSSEILMRSCERRPDATLQGTPALRPRT